MRRVLSVVATTVVVIVIAAVAAGWMTLRASLPVIDGRAELAGLHGSVRIERDADGVPRITARDRADLSRGLGYAHAQDRFFQMDLMRRAAAGELAELLGPALLEVDQGLRVHRFRTVAHDVIRAMDPPTRALLDAYVEGVNAGLASLRSRPFEYWVLRSHPRAWNAEDSILCIHAMYLQLQEPTGHGQLQRGLLRATLPAALWQFLEAGAPEWDAAVDDTRSPAPVLPPSAEVDLRTLPDLTVLPPDKLLAHLHVLGSNNWAIAGGHTATGAGMVANDMHLGYRVPTIWYRARLVVDGRSEPLDLTGVTLPGTPSTVAGSNGAIAWGFTNSYGEFENVIRLMPDADDPTSYQTSTGPRRLQYADELIIVKGESSRHLRIPLTPWGPVIGKDWEGHPYALQWTAHDPAATNLKLLTLEHTQTAAAAVQAAAGFGMPGQNFMVADTAGHIGWTIAGRLPARARAAPGVPQLSTETAPGFSGWLAPEQQPRVLDPPTGLLWSANARVVGGPSAALIGEDSMDRGARAGQIRDDLLAMTGLITPAASLGVQLDDRALFLERWRVLLAELLNRTAARLPGGAPGPAGHAATRAVLARWSGHAAPADAAYRLVAQFREQVQARVFFMVIAAARARDPAFEFDIPSAFEGPLWRLVTQQPAHLLAPRYRDWDALLLESLTAAEELPARCRTLATCTWGTVNEVHVAHPLARALPLLSSLLDMPLVRVPGGREDMPRIQGPDYGASERFSVSPGHESKAYFHMPGGQSGHPLSPFYRAGFDAWARGAPTPFLPGAPIHQLLLTSPP